MADAKVCSQMSGSALQLEEEATQSVPEKDGLTREPSPRPRRIRSSGPSIIRDTPAAHRLGSPQPVAISAFAISKGPTLDHADGWECEHGPECPDRTRVGELYSSVEDARMAAPHFALRVAQLTLSRGTDDFSSEVLRFVDRLEPIHVVYVEGLLTACFDYRDSGCLIPDAYEQLCRGEGSGEAWDTVREHRRRFGAQSALLPGASQEGHLFAFISACRQLAMTSVDTISVDSASL